MSPQPKPRPGLAAMAGAKLRIYHTSYRLNLSFANIVTNCCALGESGF